MRIQLGDALGDALADVVEVGRIASYHAAEDDDAVHVSELGQLGGGIDEFKTAGHALDGDVLRRNPILFQFLDGACQEFVGDGLVPLCYDDAEAHFAGIGYGQGLVGGVGIGGCGHGRWGRGR